MATFDPEQQAIVVSIVYDGLPEAGKTTSVRALARSFGREVYTPEEQNGRTVYFDWLEHTGGRFDGGPIRCQVLSVPGQGNRSHFRQRLLERADVVVFVADTSEDGWPASLAQLRELLAWRKMFGSGLPIGVLLQANRRDADNAVPLDQLKGVAASLGVGLVESIAPEGTGVRESFVFALRLALDRTRELQKTGTLPLGETAATADRILSDLCSLSAAPSPAPSLSASRAEMESLHHAAGYWPSDEVPSGWVWPPVDGRIVLREALFGWGKSEMDPPSDAAIDLPTGFRLSTSESALFTNAERGRHALIVWARLHASAQTLLSSGRCIVLSETGSGRFRLWQIVRKEPSLRALFVDEGTEADPSARPRSLEVAHRLLAEANLCLQKERVMLDCNLDSIGLSESGKPMYVGDVPLPLEISSLSLERHGAQG